MGLRIFCRISPYLDWIWGIFFIILSCTRRFYSLVSIGMFMDSTHYTIYWWECGLWNWIYQLEWRAHMEVPYQQQFKWYDSYVYEGPILTNDMVWHKLSKVGVTWRMIKIVHIDWCHSAPSFEHKNHLAASGLMWRTPMMCVTCVYIY